MRESESERERKEEEREKRGRESEVKEGERDQAIDRGKEPRERTRDGHL